MVSYFVPRGRFLIKAGNIRQAYQKHSIQQQPQQQQGKWPILRHFRQTFSTRSTAPQSGQQGKICINENQTNEKVEAIIRHNVVNKTINGKTAIQRQYGGDSRTRRSIWMKWTGFLLRWAPIGFCVFGAIEWQFHKYKTNEDTQPRTASNFQAKIYCSLPLRIISRCWGWLAACYIPVPLRPYIYGWYSNTFDVNLEEALYADYKHYTSLAEFFTRPLRDDVRPIDQHSLLVSPADGKVLHFGTASNSLIEQVKGVNYNIESFLGPATWVTKGLEMSAEYAELIKEKDDNSTTLYQCVIYLAPGDYHRFHSPTEWKPTVRRHFAGELLSVSPRVASWLPELFCLNERAIYLGSWEYGFFSYTAVGATNVGSVQIFMDENLKTNRWVGLNVGAHKKRSEYEEMMLVDGNVDFKRGDLVGQFNMGSTIVLLFEAPKNFEFNIKAGQKIRFGEPLGHIKAGND